MGIGDLKIKEARFARHILFETYGFMVTLVRRQKTLWYNARKVMEIGRLIQEYPANLKS